MRLIWPATPKLEEIEEELHYALEQGRITMCSQVQKLEEEISRFLEVPYVTCMSNATTALILMLRGLKGDILVPSWTFHATLAACWWNQLNPIYVDVKPGTLTIDVEDAERKITAKTCAIMAVNVFGLPPDIDDLQEFADAHGIRLYFDSSQGFGSRYKGQRIGGFGDAEAFSFSATKLFSTGEGGAVTTTDELYHNSMQSGRQWGDPGGTFDESTYDPVSPGLNGHMTEWEAILGLHQLPVLDKLIEDRVQKATHYRECLGDEVEYQTIPDDRTTTYKDFMIFVPPDSKQNIERGLKKAGIEYKNYFFPCHLTRAYHKAIILPVTEEYYKRAISLPIHQNISMKDIEIVSHTVLEGL